MGTQAPRQEQHGYNDQDVAARAIPIIHQQVYSPSANPATVAATSTLTARPPTTPIPNPAPLSPGSCLSWNHSHLSAGRKTDLLALTAILMGGITVAMGPTAASTSFGRMGNTTLNI